jgi:hypothetical protein
MFAVHPFASIIKLYGSKEFNTDNQATTFVWLVGELSVELVAICFSTQD